MKEKYKKLLSSVLASGIILTTAGCAKQPHKIDPRAYNPNTREYTVQYGDTLTGIASYFYGTIFYYDDIANYNGISDPNKIREGQVIYLPPIEDMCYYYIQKGDTLSDICFKKYGNGTSEYVNRLAEYNGIYEPNKIVVGQRIIIPEKETLIQYTSGKGLSLHK